MPAKRASSSFSLTFAAEGHAVGLIARDADALHHAAESLCRQAAWAVADVADAGQLSAAADALEAETGPPDI